MGLNYPPIGYTGENVEGSNQAQTKPGIVRAATNAEAEQGTRPDVFISPATATLMRAAATNLTPKSSPILQSNATTGAAPSGTTGSVNLMNLQGEQMEQFILGSGQTIIAPRMGASGLLVSLDLTDNEGAEYNWGAARTNSKFAYTIGTSPGFFLRWTFTCADVSGCDPVGIAFRKAEANNAAMESYTDFAFIGLSATDGVGTIYTKTRLNSGSVVNTNTTNVWTDGQTHTLTILVSKSGAVNYLVDNAPAAVSVPFSFDVGDVVCPFFELLHGTTSPGAINWVSFQAGPQ